MHTPRTDRTSIRKLSAGLMASASVAILLAACVPSKGFMTGMTKEKPRQNAVSGERRAPMLNPQAQAAPSATPVEPRQPSGSFESNPYDYYNAKGDRIAPQTAPAPVAPIAPQVKPQSSMQAPQQPSAASEDNFFTRLFSSKPQASEPVESAQIQQSRKSFRQNPNAVPNAVIEPSAPATALDTQITEAETPTAQQQPAPAAQAEANIVEPTPTQQTDVSPMLTTPVPVTQATPSEPLQPQALAEVSSEVEEDKPTFFSSLWDSVKRPAKADEPAETPAPVVDVMVDEQPPAAPQLVAETAQPSTGSLQEHEQIVDAAPVELAAAEQSVESEPADVEIAAEEPSFFNKMWTKVKSAAPEAQEDAVAQPETLARTELPTAGSLAEAEQQALVPLDEPSLEQPPLEQVASEEQPAETPVSETDEESPSFFKRTWNSVSTPFVTEEEAADQGATEASQESYPALSSVPPVPAQFEEIKETKDTTREELEAERWFSEEQKQALVSEPSQMEDVTKESTTAQAAPEASTEVAAFAAPVEPLPASAVETTPAQPVLLGSATDATAVPAAMPAQVEASVEAVPAQEPQTAEAEEKPGTFFGLFSRKSEEEAEPAAVTPQEPTVAAEPATTFQPAARLEDGALEAAPQEAAVTEEKPSRFLSLFSRKSEETQPEAEETAQPAPQLEPVVAQPQQPALPQQQIAEPAPVASTLPSLSPAGAPVETVTAEDEEENNGDEAKASASSLPSPQILQTVRMLPSSRYSERVRTQAHPVSY